MTEPLLSDLLSEDQATRELGYKNKRTLRRWRDLGEGPPFVRIGRFIKYRRSSIAAWIDSQERQAA